MSRLLGMVLVLGVVLVMISALAQCVAQNTTTYIISSVGPGGDK